MTTPPPSPPPRPADLPHPLSFFVTGRERSAILRALRRFAPDRSAALFIALGLTAQPQAQERDHAPK